MGFKFAWLVELLEELERNKYQQRATYSKHDDPSHRIIGNWYQKHTTQISRSGPPAIAFLSCILPEKRPDRTYNLQQKRLCQVFGRTLGLGSNRRKILESWQEEDGQDFPTCLERTMKDCEFDKPPSGREVTLEEIDIVLTRIAANNIASAPAVRTQASDQQPSDILKPIILRLQSNEAKWLARMIMKSYSPVEIPEYAALYGFHFLLPKLLAIQNSFEAVVDIISAPELIQLNPRPSKEYESALLPILAKEIKPRLGVMIRRQPFDKARSIKHCVKIANSRTMSIERKYDGEYCQIHIDNSKGQGSIQIFSKSGKVSTQDRIGLHGVIKASLKLKRPECKIKNRAILEGELVIFSRNERDILPFHHIRKHVRHGGRRIGTEMDSPKKVGEHLMIVFFDVLLLDDKVMLTEPHRIRRAHLKGLVTPIEGEAQVVERHMIDFNSSRAKAELVQSFSHAIRMRWEGFVLKGLDDPYYTWKQDVRGIRGIKLKKDYIAGLGDSADLCIVGGHRDPKIETELNIGRLSWTTFYVACLTNKLQVQRFDARPTFKIIDCLGPGSLSKDDILTLNIEGRMVEDKYVADSEHMLIKHVRRDIPLPMSIYTKPMVVEIFGAGYERPQTADFYILRFPRRVGSKIKIHKDRDVADTVDFDELQRMAEVSLKEADDHPSQEEIEWMERLLAADPKSKYIVEKSQSTSPSKTQHSATTASLTPAGHKWSTQPSPVFVRVDTGELTSAELSERYPDSAPQTPSRRSDSTASPTTTRSREISRRDFALETSPTPVSRKRKRVAFEPTNRGANPRTMSDMTEFTRRDEAKRHEKADEQAMMPPPGRKKREIRSTEESSGSTEVASSAIAQPPSSTDSINADDLVRPSQTASPAADTLPQPAESPQSPSSALSSTRQPTSSLLANLTITQPIYLTTSLKHTFESPPSNETFPQSQTPANLTSQKLTHTAIPKTFIRHLFPPRSITTPSPFDGPHPVILINTDFGRQASKEIRALIDNLGMPRPGWEPTREKPACRDVVVFDYRVLGTIGWKRVLKRTRGNKDKAEEEENDEEEWKRYFCGRLEIGLAVAEDRDASEEGSVQFNAYGEMIWE